MVYIYGSVLLTICELLRYGKETAQVSVYMLNIVIYKCETLMLSESVG